MEPDILGLRNWRKNKGISLEAISASTKLSVSQLRAIETGDFKKLPGGIYTTSYIKQYAKAIEFDVRELLDAYYEYCNPGSKEVRPEGRRGIMGPLLQH